MLRSLTLGLWVVTLCGCPITTSSDCATDSDCPQGRCLQGGCGPMCLDDLECPRDQTCTLGACRPRPQCASAGDCAQGFTCTEGRCLCSSNEACLSTQQCWQGRCEAPSRCKADTDCPFLQHCELVQGSCLAPCTLSTDCAPNMAPELTAVLFSCEGGRCLMRCINERSCGGRGVVCEQGVCRRSDCTTASECPPGQYCTSTTAGRCVEYQACQSSAGCPSNSTCRAFDAAACPPGFDCQAKLCQPLPRCLTDTDCAPSDYCGQGHCQPAQACSNSVPCLAGQLCVAQRCVPSGGCRGHSDCPEGQACTDGACRSPPSAQEISRLSLAPRVAVLTVGDTLRLSLVAFTFNDTSFPLSTGEFSVVETSGAASDAATVTPEGLVTAVHPGTVRVRATGPSADGLPVEVSLTLLPALAEGRRVTVVDATTRQPLSGVRVLGCDTPPEDAPCPQPLLAVTDASGVALLPASKGAIASLSVASPELREDGAPRYERVSVMRTAARDLLLPLGKNPARASAGFTAELGFSRVHSSGPLWIGYSVLSIGDVADLDLTTLLGEPFILRATPEHLTASTVPGSFVGLIELSLGERQSLLELKKPALSFGLGQPGQRVAVAFAGKLGPPVTYLEGPMALLSRTAAMDFALEPSHSIPLLPLIEDRCIDLDKDDRCGYGCCPETEEIPNYYGMPQLSLRPGREQPRRTEVAVPDLPPELDTAVVSAGVLLADAGLVPLGFAARTGGLPGPDGRRPVGTILLRSGAPYGGVEAGAPALWAFATRIAEDRGALSGRLVRAPTLGAHVRVPGFLPLPLASYDPRHRTLTPEPRRWASLQQEGASLARAIFTGPQSRHVVLFSLDTALPSLRLPDAPDEGGVDAAALSSASAEVAALALTPGVTPEEALDLQGPNLLSLTDFLEAYSRARTR
jgi:hypothetical protein